jgi:tetratricopeptide (TPR) repeat protein
LTSGKIFFIALLAFLLAAAESRSGTQDTTLVRRLFEKGNQYINGPSDSLIHYYEKALGLIRENLETLHSGNEKNPELQNAFRELEIRALIELGIEHFFQSNYEKSLSFYFQALEQARTMEDVELISECYSEIGIVYKNQGKYDEALEYYDNALKYARQTHDTSWIASCHVNVGNVYKEKGYFTMALSYYMMALEDLEPLGHNRRVAACYQNIGDIYRIQLDFVKSLDYYSRSLQLALETEDLVREKDCYLNIGNVYFLLDQYRLARDYYNKAYDLFQQLGYSHELDNCYILIADTYLAEGNLELATDLYNQALDIAYAEKDLTTRAETLEKLGVLNLRKNNYTAAKEFSYDALAIAQQIGALEIQIRVQENISEILEQTGQEKEALQVYKEYSRLKDSLFSIEKFKAITEMDVKYETAKQQQQLELLEERTQVQQLKLSQRNRVYTATLIIVFLLGVLAYILHRNQRLKARHKAIELEQKLMRSQMNPHFIFNSLIAIQSYIYQKEAVKAGDYLAKFAELVRITLENSRAEFVPLEKELKMLNAYLELQSLRFEGKFTYDITLYPELVPDHFQIPPMMAQPFIENAIEHGIRHKKGNGMIAINFEKQNGCFLCRVEDDGIGRERAREVEKKRKHQSMATSITRERIEILTKKEKNRFTLKIVDLKDDAGSPSGTRVEFTMPFRQTDG